MVNTVKVMWWVFVTALFTPIWLVMNGFVIFGEAMNVLLDRLIDLKHRLAPDPVASGIWRRHG